MSENSSLPSSALEAGPSAYGLRFAVADDRGRLVELFNRSFLGRGVELPVDQAFWGWRYGANGVPSHSVVAVYGETGDVVGHVGSLPLRTWCRGEERRTTLSLDHMVDREHRRGLQRRGLLARMVAHWVDEYCRSDRDFLGWGFPNECNFRLGHRFNEYSVVRNVNALSAPDLGALHHPHGGVVVRRVDDVPAEADELWRAVRGEIEMGVVRDAAYLGWRYVRHPRFRYVLLEARDAADGSLRGLAVLRMGAAQEDVLMILEWLLPIGDADACRALLRATAELAQEHRAGAVSAWFPEALAWFDLFQELGFHVRFTPTVQVCRSGDPGVSIADVRRHFYSTFGDVEYY